MKKLFYILIIIIYTISLSPINYTNAQNETTSKDTYHYLAPLPCDSGEGCVGGQLETFDPTGQNKIGLYLNVMIRIFIGICAVLAVIMIVVGGLEYMTSELVSSKEQGRHRITGAIFGLVLALGAWTILNQINPELLKTDLKSLSEVIVEVTVDDNIPQTPDSNGKYKNGYKQGTNWESIAGAKATLPAGVSVNNPECVVIGAKNCTSTRGLSLDYVNTLLKNCKNCKNITITGGTEFWLHGGQNGNTSHGKGSPTIDLRKDANLTSYIKSGEKTTPNRWIKDGISYLEESDHWHVGR